VLRLPSQAVVDSRFVRTYSNGYKSPPGSPRRAFRCYGHSEAGQSAVSQTAAFGQLLVAANPASARTTTVPKMITRVRIMAQLSKPSLRRIVFVGISRSDGATFHLALNAAVGISGHATKFVQFVRHAADVVHARNLFLLPISGNERNGLLALLWGAHGLATLAPRYTARRHVVPCPRQRGAWKENLWLG
jgi:hypothetical protein